MNKPNSKSGLENRVLTPALLKSNFATMQNRVKRYLTIKYRYATIGNKVSGNDIDDYLQDGLERLLKSFDFATCLFNGNEITIADFQRLWLFASKQTILTDNVRSTMSNKGERTKIVVSNIVTEMDGKQTISNNVENRLIEIDSVNTKNVLKVNVRNIIRKAIETAETERDRLFFERVLAHLVIESSIRKANKVGKAIVVQDIIDCFSNQFQNKDAYFMFRKRMETDIRLKKLKMAA